jgi:hypothetical protein
VPTGAVVEFLRLSVVPAAWPGSRLIDAQVMRMRFSPGEECAAVATLDLDPPLPEPARVVVTFLPDVARIARQQPEGIYSQELECLAEIFPSDWRLPQLGRVLSPAYMRDRLLTAAGIDGAGPDLDVTLLRYRPHSRAVVLYGLSDGDGHRREIIGKVYRSESKARRAWRTLDAIYRETAATPVIPRPLALIEETALVLMEKADGHPLPALLASANLEEARLALGQVADALRGFHAVNPGKLKARRPEKDVEGLIKLARDAAPEAAETLGLGELLAQIEARFQDLALPDPPTLTHGGCKPSAVLIEGNHATFVDLDSCAAGDPARDVASFASKLRAMELEGGTGALSGLADEFVALHVARSGDPGIRERVRVYEGIFLAGLGLKHLNTSWRGEAGASPAEALIEAAKDFLR